MSKKSRKITKTKSQPQEAEPRTSRTHVLLIAVLLIAVTAVAYWHATECGFLRCFDDETYVTDNYHLTRGFAHGVAWAFGSEYRAANWHPLTWISLLIDYQFYGLDPKGYHLTNVLIHIANTLLLFAVLVRMTGAEWKSGFVAALFAVHPLHVESVAWVAERKDVLSTFFWLLTTYAYALYATRPRARTYVAVIVAFVLGLLAKPMLVSLPLVLLLLDFWPLRRAGESGKWKVESRDRPFWTFRFPLSTFHLLLEKLPLFALSAASCVITVIAQRAGGAVVGLREVPPGSRIENAAISYVAYIVKMIWPAKLAAYYPYPQGQLPMGEALGAGLLLVAITALALRAARRRPYIAVGWLWYVITLVPVIGLVQVGSQAMADRYTYVPLIGLFIAIAWAIPDLGQAASRPNGVLKGARSRNALSLWKGAAAAAVVLALTLTTRAQVEYWRDPITLFKHAIQVTKDNASAYQRVGRAFEDNGDLGQALDNYARAVELAPDYADAQMSLGRVLIKTAKNADRTVDMAKINEGMSRIRLAHKLGLNNAELHQNLAFAYFTVGDLDRAERECRTAQRLDPRYAPSEFTLGNVRFQQRKLDDAIRHWRKSVEYDPTFYQPHFNLAYAYYLKRDYASAWREVHLYEQCGERADSALRDALAARMPEPK